MKARIKTIGLIILTSILCFVVGGFIFINYVPVGPFVVLGTDKFGTVSVTELSSTDKLSAFPTTYNANLTALNDGKVDVASTTWPQLTTASGLTTASSLATIGTITTGVWNGTAIGVAYNGTGTTSPTANQIMFGNGASGLKVIGFGSSGQFLTSGGADTAPSWTTSAIDTSLNYNWTGTNLFTGLNASSTVANPLVLNGLSINTPGSLPSATTTMRIDGSGNITFTAPKATSTTFTSSGTWVRPDYVDYVKVRVVGAGGGGGGGGSDIGSGGGGGGGYAEADVSVSGNVTVTVGSGGAGDTGGGSGSAGGNSSFAGDVTVTANGGSGGSYGGSGGSGGGTTNADVAITGQTGQGQQIYGGTSEVGGAGGSSVMGMGGHSAYLANAPNGSGYGGGGGGGSGLNNDGGDGAGGIVIVTWYE